MSYRRRSSWQYGHSYPTPTKVSVHWSAKSSAYMVNFSDTKHWNEMQVLINFIKGLNVSERDCQCDESSGKKVWTWYFVEQYLEPFKAIVDSFKGSDIFEWDFVPKPVGGNLQSHFVSTDTYFQTFQNLTGQDISKLDHDQAKKIYRRWMIKNHPDIGGDSKTASSVNECWSNLEVIFYKKKKEQEYVS